MGKMTEGSHKEIDLEEYMWCMTYYVSIKIHKWIVILTVYSVIKTQHWAGGKATFGPPHLHRILVSVSHIKGFWYVYVYIDIYTYIYLYISIYRYVYIYNI